MKQFLKITNYGRTYDPLKFYTLEITPKWTSDLHGNPVAILVEAEHLDQSSSSNPSLFTYKSLWALYQLSEDESIFKGIDLLSEEEKDIYMFLEFKEDENLYINSLINPDNSKIEIVVSREYTGIIKFKLTPIMSYGPLENLTKTITLDLNKIASGEICLSKWSYFINQEQSIVTKVNNSKTSKSKDIKTTKTTKTTVKTNNLKESDTESNNTNDTEVITEKVTTEASSTIFDEEPVSHITYTYTLDFTYGFDSYMFEDLVINEKKKHIHFYDVSRLNLTLNEMSIEDKLKKILNDLVSDHVESIPKDVIRGGNDTVRYKLGSSSCKLQPNKLYLAIINLETKIGENVIPHYDYRYLYTNQVFNESFNTSEDFSELSIPALPVLDLTFDKKIDITYSDDSNKDCSIKYLNDHLCWVSDDKDTTTYKFDFTAKILNSPKQVSICYNDLGFNSNYILKDYTNEGLILSYDDINDTSYNNNVLLTETKYKGSESFEEAVEFHKTYEFKLNHTTHLDLILIGAIKTNLLNINNNVNLYKLQLSELHGLNNTMIMESDSIFSVGMHNDGDDDDEAWYGEGGALSEGYADKISENYDDSLAYNLENELNLYNYSTQPKEYNYYLKHSTEYLKQFGLEKDDVEEAFSTYINADDSPNEIGKSLETRGIAPLLFVTSGYSADDANKDTTCVFAALGEYKAPSQPANGNVIKDEDDEEEEKNNFNKEHPYWFINWSAVNAFNLKQFLGTFILKYSTKFGTSRYTTTNNYFMMFPSNNDIILSYYLEDLKREKEYNFLSDIKSDAKKVKYEYSAFLMGEWEVPYRHSAPTVSQVVTTNGDKHSTPGYSMGDLLATLLALFATVSEYVIPQEMNQSVYTLSLEDKQSVLSLETEQIPCKRTYSINLDDKVCEPLNENLTFNDVNLHELNKLFPSSNLTISEFKSDSKLSYSEKLVLDPLKGLIPDFNESVYMAEISPYGDVSIYPKQSTSLGNNLYYWNDSKQSYEDYDNTVGADLYKYGKFSKYTYVGDGLNTFKKDYNISNYDFLERESELIEGFIKFHPLKECDQFLTKHRITCSLKYDSRFGFYTDTTSGKDYRMHFYFKKKPSSTDKNHRKRLLLDLISRRSITKISPPPNIGYNDPTIYVDPKHRI